MENKTIGEILIELRLNKGKSRAEVASDLGISKSAIAMYELGKRIPKDDVKIKFAKYYGKSVATIFFAR